MFKNLLSRVIALALNFLGIKLKYTASHLSMALTCEIHLDITFAECGVVYYSRLK